MTKKDFSTTILSIRVGMIVKEKSFKMIYITGDCHSNFERFIPRNFPEQKEMTKDDYVIICGDFGGVRNKDGEI